MRMGSRTGLVALTGLALGTIWVPSAAADDPVVQAVTFEVVENGDQVAVQVDGNKVTVTVDPVGNQTCTAPTVLGGAIDVALLREEVKDWDGTPATTPKVIADATVELQADGSIVRDLPPGIPEIGVHPAPYSVEVEGLSKGAYGAFTSCVDVALSTDTSVVTSLVVRNFTVEQDPGAGGGDSNGSVGLTGGLSGLFGSS